MSGVVTRSQSQGDKEENNMEPSNREGNVKGTSKKSRKQSEEINGSEEEWASDNSSVNYEIDQKSEKADKETQQRKFKGSKHAKWQDASNREDNHAEVYKGYVAERVDKINSNPSSPTKPTKMPKTKPAAKNRTLVSQNGQLGIQGVQSFASSLASKLNEVSDKEKATTAEKQDTGLTSILRELAATVKKLETQLDKMEADRKQVDDKVSAVEVVQQQEVVKLHGVIDQLDEQDDKIQALVSIVIKQDQQIQTLTNQVNSAYASKCHKNVIINGLAETQGENTIHEVANLFKNILKISGNINIKYARRMGKGQFKPMLVRLHNANDKVLISRTLTN